MRRIDRGFLHQFQAEVPPVFKVPGENKVCDVDEGLEVVVLREDRYAIWREEVFQ